jgi:hypothetical protein
MAEPRWPGDTRPDFEVGNTMALRHGARSPRTYGPLAQELAAGLLADRPDLEAFPEVVSAWADAEARADLLRRWLDDNGMFDDDGAPRSGTLKWLASFDKRAQELRTRLGLDPRSEAELAGVRAEASRQIVDLDAIRQRGREARIAADARTTALQSGSADLHATLTAETGHAAVEALGGEPGDNQPVWDDVGAVGASHSMAAHDAGVAQ